MFTGKAVAALVEKRGRGRPRKHPYILKSVVVKPKSPEEKSPETKTNLTKEAAKELLINRNPTPVQSPKEPATPIAKEPRNDMEKQMEKKKVVIKLGEASSKIIIH